MEDKDEVLNFINRRFKDNCHWNDGNCYWFARILCDRFNNLELCYDSIPGHFVAFHRGKNKVYDWNGIYKPQSELIPLWLIKIKDKSWYNRLIRDCVK